MALVPHGHGRPCLLAPPGLNEDSRHQSTQGARPCSPCHSRWEILGQVQGQCQDPRSSTILMQKSLRGILGAPAPQAPCALLCCRARAAPRSPGVQASPCETLAPVPLPQCHPGCWHCPASRPSPQLNWFRSWQHLQWMHMKDLGVSCAPGGNQASHGQERMQLGSTQGVPERPGGLQGEKLQGQSWNCGGTVGSLQWNQGDATRT